MEPFTSNSPMPLVVSSVAVILLAGVATALERSRELGGSILRVSTTRVRRVRVSSALGLVWRLGRATTGWWVAGIALGGALFTAMGSSVVKTARQGQLSGGFLGAQLAGGDPVSAFFGCTGTVVAVVVVASGFLSALEAATEERRGPGEYLRAAGTSPARVLAGHLGVALFGSALALGWTAVLIYVRDRRVRDQEALGIPALAAARATEDKGHAHLGLLWGAGRSPATGWTWRGGQATQRTSVAGQ